MQQIIIPVPTFKLSFQVQFFARTYFRVFKSLAKIAKIRFSRKFPLIRYGQKLDLIKALKVLNEGFTIGLHVN